MVKGDPARNREVNNDCPELVRVRKGLAKVEPCRALRELDLQPVKGEYEKAIASLQ